MLRAKNLKKYLKMVSVLVITCDGQAKGRK